MVRVYHFPLDDVAHLVGGGFYQLNDDVWEWFQTVAPGGSRINDGPQPRCHWYFERNSTYWEGRYHSIISFRFYDDNLAALFKLTWV
jgi:hypothetical protein